MHHYQLNHIHSVSKWLLLFAATCLPMTAVDQLTQSQTQSTFKSGIALFNHACMVSWWYDIVFELTEWSFMWKCHQESVKIMKCLTLSLRPSDDQGHSALFFFRLSLSSENSSQQNTFKWHDKINIVHCYWQNQNCVLRWSNNWKQNSYEDAISHSMTHGDFTGMRAAGWWASERRSCKHQTLQAKKWERRIGFHLPGLESLFAGWNTKRNTKEIDSQK